MVPDMPHLLCFLAARIAQPDGARHGSRAPFWAAFTPGAQCLFSESSSDSEKASREHSVGNTQLAKGKHGGVPMTVLR
jgi:hypothetical protein